MLLLFLWVLVLTMVSVAGVYYFETSDEIRGPTARSNRYMTVHTVAHNHVDVEFPEDHGIYLRPGQRILLRGQDKEARNGIYKMTTKLERAEDFAEPFQSVEGRQVFVLDEGILYVLKYGNGPPCESFPAATFLPYVVRYTEGYPTKIKHVDQWTLGFDGKWLRTSRVNKDDPVLAYYGPGQTGVFFGEPPGAPLRVFPWRDQSVAWIDDELRASSGNTPKR